MAENAFQAIADLMQTARKGAEAYRDYHLDHLAFQAISPPVPPVRANTQWGNVATFGVPERWQDASYEHLAYVTTQSGIPMGAGIIEPGEGVIMAGAADMPKDSGPQNEPANLEMAIFKHLAQRREQAVGSRLAQENLVRVGGDGALTLWFSGFPNGDNHAEVWGVHGHSVFNIVGEGPSRSQGYWGQVLWTVVGSWAWLH